MRKAASEELRRGLAALILAASQPYPCADKVAVCVVPADVLRTLQRMLGEGRLPADPNDSINEALRRDLTV